MDLAVSFAQQRLLFLDRLTPGDTTYNISAALRLFGDVDFGAVVAALNEIVRRHDVLRTRFVAREGEARQEVLDRLELAPSLIDLGAL
ncbi:condensation domain-containing protein, partial [Methylosinus sp. Sm6]|uniref:condensation domain-containing protein n=1 Tax=Methylosinus sp. Sm6 TaxID=2866948 RepID=UPI00351CC3CF